MKKLFAVCIIGLALGVTGVFAQHDSGKLGIGAQGGWSGGGSGALSLKLPSLPVFWAISVWGGENYFGLGVSGDVYIFEGSLVPNIGLGWYIGPGGYVNLSFWGSDSDKDGMGFGAGVRGVAGLSCIPFGSIPLEIYLQANVGLGLSISNPFHFPEIPWGGNLGIRVWL